MSWARSSTRSHASSGSLAERSVRASSGSGDPLQTPGPSRGEAAPVAVPLPERRRIPAGRSSGSTRCGQEFAGTRRGPHVHTRSTSAALAANWSSRFVMHRPHRRDVGCATTQPVACSAGAEPPVPALGKPGPHLGGARVSIDLVAEFLQAAHDLCQDVVLPGLPLDRYGVNRPLIPRWEVAATHEPGPVVHYLGDSSPRFSLIGIVFLLTR